MRAPFRVAVITGASSGLGASLTKSYAAKAGWRASAKALRSRLEPYGVGVTIVRPGFFQSPMTARFEGPTPFCLSTARAAGIVKRGVDHSRRRIAFPWPLVLGLRFCGLVPAIAGNAILRRWRFRIHVA
jgi:NAD(P)-dependent dehydrogenase (short-subunit alcohol dehydrogenase family)